MGHDARNMMLYRRQAPSIPAATLRSSGDSQVGRSATQCPPAAASTRAAASGGAAPPIIVHAEPITEGDGCPRGSQWSVQKFGGTCVSSAERIAAAAQLVLKAATEGEQQVIVVSAMGSHPDSKVKVTDLLLNMVAKAVRQDEAFLLDLAALQEKHVETAKQVLGNGKLLNEFVSRLLDDISNLKAMLRAISIAGMATDAFADFVVGHGELWCALLFAAACRVQGGDSAFMDTRDVLVVRATADGNNVDVEYDLSNAKLDKWAEQYGAPPIIVATGFIAKDPKGYVTTLKRNGSDYSATILGALFQAGAITIWTDVDGVYSADPRKVSEAVCLDKLSYHEAWELSYFGANVLHPRTTLPAMKYRIPITIRNIFSLEAPGTMIGDYKTADDAAVGQFVKGFATIDDVTLVNVEGTGMVGVPGTASDIFGSVRDAGVNVIMISQASSEHSVCFAVKSEQATAAVDCLEEKFADAIRAGRISHVQKIDNCCILAAVGQQMASRKGVSATMFSALAKANINIRAIAQGSSEYNITILVEQCESVRALRAVHARFYLAQLPVAVGIVGPGLIGSTLLAQIEQQLPKLRENMDLDVRVLGLASSTRMLLSDSGIALDSWRDDFARDAQPVDLTAFATHLARSFIPNAVIIDATAAEQPAEHYEEWMKAGVSVITPNKKAGSGPLARYKAIKAQERQSFQHFFYEGTVGAGLPILATLKHLIDTGDKVVKVQGIFSGTLSYIFNEFKAGGAPFSAIVQQAKEAGYTEPDPRDDLGGTDVQRKVTILARECGMELELDDVPVDSLVPEELQSSPTAEAFLDALPEYDAQMAAKVQAAADSGKVLRYVGVVDCQSGSGSVRLEEFDASHPFAQLQGSDNIIEFTTQRYLTNPLIIRGPGAGAEVTAGGVFSDLLRLAAFLDGPS